MIKTYIYLVLILGAACCAFSQENKTGNILVFSSMDGEQVHVWEAEEARVLWALSLDSSMFHHRNWDSIDLRYDMLVPQLNGEVPDSSTLVVLIPTVFHGEEDEPTLFIYAQFECGHLTGVYHLDVGQAPSTWMAVETYFAVVCEDGKPRVKIDAVLETIGFGLSCCIRFPYNEEGVYDDVHRYQRVHAEFEVPEDVFKLLGQAAAPPVKPVVRDAPVDTTGVGR